MSRDSEPVISRRVISKEVISKIMVSKYLINEMAISTDLNAARKGKRLRCQDIQVWSLP